MTWVLIIAIGGSIYTQPMPTEEHCRKVQKYADREIATAHYYHGDWAVICVPQTFQGEF
jgi:hypothetical protein